MRTYAQALARVWTSEPCSTAGGRTRYLTWELIGEEVTASIYGNVVVAFAPDHVEITTADYPLPSTFDAIATALDVSRYGVGTIARVPYFHGHRMTEGMRLSYAGERLPDPSWAPYEADWLNHRLSPMAEARFVDLRVVDVADGGDGTDRVALTSYEDKDPTPTARKIAAAYVGRPHARTSVVRTSGRPGDRTIVIRVAA